MNLHIFTDNMNEVTEAQKKEITDLFAKRVGETMGKLKIKEIGEQVKQAMVDAAIEKTKL